MSSISGSTGERPMSREMALIQAKVFLESYYGREFPFAEVENSMTIVWPFVQIILDPKATNQRFMEDQMGFSPEQILFLCAAFKTPSMAAMQEALRVVGGGEKCPA